MKHLIRQFSLKQIVLSDVLLSTPFAVLLIVAAEPIAQWAGGPGAVFYRVVGVLTLLWCMNMAAMVVYDRWLQSSSTFMVRFDVTWGLLSLAATLWFAQSLFALGWVLFALNIIVPLEMAWMKRVVIQKQIHPHLEPAA